MAAARDAAMDRFLDHFDEKSGALLGMFWTVSQRYGYVDSDDLAFLTDLQVTGSEVRGDSARVEVSDGRKSGTLCMRRDDGRWKIDLLAGDDCFDPGTRSSPTDSTPAPPTDSTSEPSPDRQEVSQ